MANRNEKSSGEGIIKVANVLQVVFSILCVLGGIVMIVAGAMAQNYYFSSNVSVTALGLIIGGVLFIIIGLIAIAIEAMFVRCYGEMAVDLHCIRNSNATLAEFVDRADIARRKKEQKDQQ